MSSCLPGISSMSVASSWKEGKPGTLLVTGAPSSRTCLLKSRKAGAAQLLFFWLGRVISAEPLNNPLECFFGLGGWRTAKWEGVLLFIWGPGALVMNSGCCYRKRKGQHVHFKRWILLVTDKLVGEGFDNTEEGWTPMDAICERWHSVLPKLLKSQSI